jgi:Fe2+ transport system protein FeoA
VNTDKTLPLDRAWAGALVELVVLSSNSKSSRRLAELGLLPHTRIKVLSCSHGQPLILRVRGSKIAIDRQTAHQILVRPVCKRPKPRHHGRAWPRNWRRQKKWRKHHGPQSRWFTALIDALSTFADETDEDD